MTKGRTLLVTALRFVELFRAPSFRCVLHMRIQARLQNGFETQCLGGLDQYQVRTTAEHARVLVSRQREALWKIVGVKRCRGLEPFVRTSLNRSPASSALSRSFDVPYPIYLVRPHVGSRSPQIVWLFPLPQVNQGTLRDAAQVARAGHSTELIVRQLLYVQPSWMR